MTTPFRLAAALILTLAMCNPMYSHAGPALVRDPAQDLADSISNKKVSLHYSEEKIRAAITRFNLFQNHQFNLKEDADLRPSGHHVATFMDAGPYFVVQFSITEEGHTDAVDDGQDTDRSLVFCKKSLKLLSDIPGQLYGTHTQLRLAVPGRHTCAGFEAEGSYVVHDISSGLALFTDSLPRGTFQVQAENARNSTSFLMQSIAQEIVPNVRKARACELPYWARFTETHIVISCDIQAHQCRKTSVLVKRHEGCATVGGCD